MAQSADAYFIGRVIGSSGFRDGSFCRWWIIAGDQWKLMGGLDRGQTQTDSSAISADTCVWSHPIDLYYEFTGIRGWPKIAFEVWQHDSLGRSYLDSYGFCNLPSSPGNHNLTVDLWSPVGSIMEDLTSNIIGGTPHLRDQNIVNDSSDRFRIKTENSGKIQLNVSLILGRVSQFQVAF